MTDLALFLLGNAGVATAAALFLVLLLRWRSVDPRLESLLWLGIALRFLLPPLTPAPALFDARTVLPLVATPPSVAALSPIAGATEPGRAGRGRRVDVPVGETVRVPAIGSRTAPELDREPEGLPAALRLGLLLWVGGALAVLAVRLAGRLAWLRGRDVHPPPTELADAVREVGRTMRVEDVCVVVSGTLDTPAVVGFLRPRLLWPERFLGIVDRGRARTLIAHELAHVKHLDLWASLAELVVGAVWWWYPGWYWVQRRYRDASERACDARVVRHYPEHRRDYAEALLDALAAASRPAPALSRGLGDRERIRRRLRAILQPSSSGSKWRGWVAGALLLLLLTPGWLASRPGEPEGATELPMPRTASQPVPEPVPESASEPEPASERTSEAASWPASVQESRDTLERALIARLRSPNPAVRQRAVGDIGRQRIYWAMPWIYPLASDPSASVRSQVAASIGVAEPGDGIPVLLGLVGDGNTGVRRSTAWALGEYEADQLLAADALPALVNLSADADAEVRRRAGASLALTEIEGSVPILLGMLEDGSASARRTAVWGLGDRRMEDLTRRLLPLAADPDPAVRKDVARALWLLPSEAWREAVELLAIDPDPAVRASGRMALRLLNES